MIESAAQSGYTRLSELLVARQGVLRIALSGGIDSLTLMTLAAEIRAWPTIAMHAVSPAVPAEATERCRELASRFNWSLVELNADEFSNPQYVSNPVNRCYYCKSSLFDRIIEGVTAGCDDIGTLATGTNADDLGDYRPGLQAASERNVWQPYVEANINKAAIRCLARELNLGALAELPAQPCLSSRVATGIAIDARDLRFIHQVEKAVAASTEAGDIRCRVTDTGIVVQLPAGSSGLVDSDKRADIAILVQKMCAQHNRRFKGIEPYRMGSAFLRDCND
ncbi:hypothetical protein AB833_11840 [Chromatiales bacterium (ex Bugula neritina AB1)]|nr:hypothetical protein AB833_11840 [Chromatiales bacterium (ex Bugula neritina AB1)]